MNNILGIMGLGGDGGSFLDWSLYYLSDQKYFYHANLNHMYVTGSKVTFDKKQIVSNPILLYSGHHAGTAHRHAKTHPTQNTIDICVDGYREITDPDVKVLSFYCVQNSEGNWLPQAEFINTCALKFTDVKFIVFYTDEQSSIELAHRKLKVYGPYVQEIKENNGVIPQELIERSIHLVKNASKDISTWENLPNRFMLNVSDMYTNLDTKIIEIFEWAKIELHTDRYHIWQSVYTQWKNMLPKHV